MYNIRTLRKKKTKRQYNQKYGSFTPLVFISAYGGTGWVTQHFLSTLINHLAEKSEVSTSIVANYVQPVFRLP